MSVLFYYFGWPDGAVWSNLVASLICVGVAYFKLRAQQQRQHLAQIAHQNRLNRELKAHAETQMAEFIREHKAQADKHHRELLDRVSVTGLRLHPGGA